jgi:hypothetical protein|tara:strand:- start:2819 stop:3076 length:258 start_codon:yes stop_codon:yes gene_type:complete
MEGFLQPNWLINGLLGSISLLQTRHLSEPETALSPPQLPFIFLPISITPNDIIDMTIIKPTNVKIKISINSDTILIQNIQLLLFT